MEKLEKLLQANIAKMNILEAELQNTQEILASIYSTTREQSQKLIKQIQGNFSRMRDTFDDFIKNLDKQEEVEDETIRISEQEDKETGDGN